jgi:hypothetical protein
MAIAIHDIRRIAYEIPTAIDLEAGTEAASQSGVGIIGAGIHDANDDTFTLVA